MKRFIAWFKDLFKEKPMTPEEWQRLVDSGEPILHHDANGRAFLRAKVGPNKFDEWYLDGGIQ